MADLTKVNQATLAGSASYVLGTYIADGSGCLAVRLDDTSLSGGTYRVVASIVHFLNCLALA